MDPVHHSPLLTDAEIDLLITALQSESITAEERALGSFTRRKPQTLPTWSLWHLAEGKQLDQFESLGMHGKPCRPPPPRERSFSAHTGNAESRPVAHAAPVNVATDLSVPLLVSMPWPRPMHRALSGPFSDFF
jgi:hypothetical protein